MFITKQYIKKLLLGGLIGVNETWFRDRGNIRGGINLDDFKDAGAYSLFNVEGNKISYILGTIACIFIRVLYYSNYR